MGRAAYREQSIVTANDGQPMPALLKAELATLNQQQLAAKWGVEPSTIRRWLIKYGLARRQIVVESQPVTDLSGTG